MKTENKNWKFVEIWHYLKVVHVEDAFDFNEITIDKK